MNRTNRTLCFLAVLAVLVSLTCNLPFNNLLNSSVNQFSKIQFCKDVSDQGDCIEPTQSFPANTQTVWAYFTFQNMKNGTRWGRLWKQNGATYVDSRSETWSDGDKGWLAFSISDDNYLAGQFTLTLYLADRPIQAASFEVAAPDIKVQTGFPAFGPITFAHGVDQDVPVEPATTFDPGLKKIYAVFPYANMKNGLDWSCQWLFNGETLATVQDTWQQDSPDGVYVCTYVNSDGSDLSSGSYTLDLSIAGQTARSASMAIAELPTPGPDNTVEPPLPGTEDELVAPEVQPAFNMILNSPLPVLQSVAQTALDHHVSITVADKCGSDALACFSETCDNRTTGKIYVMTSSLQSPDYLLASDLAHEMTHVQEMIEGMPCGCTVQKEFYAVAAQLDFLLYSGHRDYVRQHFGAIYDDNGVLQSDLLWPIIKKAYSSSTCPDY